MPIHEPNYTQIPNIILDSLFLLSGAETKTILFICRQTFGYHRHSAKMSISFICAGTGLARQSVFTAIDSLHLRGWIEKTRVGDSFEYSLKVHAIEAVVQKLDQSKDLTSLKTRTERSKKCTTTGLKIRTEVVQKLDTNKERKIKNKERSKESPTGTDVPIADPSQDQKLEEKNPVSKKGRKRNEPRPPRSAPAVSKYFPEESVELWKRWSPMYKAFYGDLDDRSKFMEGFDFLIEHGVQLHIAQTGTIAYVNGKNTALAQGRKNSVTHPPRGDRFFTGKDGGESYCLRAYEALQEQESANNSISGQPDEDRGKDWHEKSKWKPSWDLFYKEAVDMGVEIRPQPGVGAYFYYRLPTDSAETRLPFTTTQKALKHMLDAWRERITTQVSA